MANNLSYLFVLLTMMVLGTVRSEKIVIQPRMSNGAVVDTLKRFAHHVTIEPEYQSGSRNNGPALCGGSILNKNWILTSAFCVQNSERLNVHIQRIRRNDISGSFTIGMNNIPSKVFIYPTESDDIALCKLPVDLIFSDTIKPIQILETPVESLHNKFAVLPGFDNSSSIHRNDGTLQTSYYPARSDSLVYAMLGIISNFQCMQTYKSGSFDEYNNLCASGWGSNKNRPCGTEFGNGLVVNWPANPRLVGIYSSSSADCAGSSTPSIFLNVQKYQSWIEGIISGN